MLAPPSLPGGWLRAGAGNDHGLGPGTADAGLWASASPHQMDGAGRAGASRTRPAHRNHSASIYRTNAQTGWVTLGQSLPDWADHNLLGDKGVWSSGPQIPSWFFRAGIVCLVHLVSVHSNISPGETPPRPC